MKQILKKTLILTFLICLIFPWSIVFADSTGIVPCGKSGGEPCKICDLVKGFNNLFKFGISIVAVLAILGILIAGILYMVSAGDETMMSAAKSALKTSLLGFAIVMMAWLIVNTVLLILHYKGSNWSSINC